MEIQIDGVYYDPEEVYNLLVTYASSAYDSGYEAAIEETREENK